MGLSRYEYWSERPFPSPGDLPDPQIKAASLEPPAMAGRFFITEPLGSLFLQVWSSNHQPHHPVKTCRFPGSDMDLGSQKLWDGAQLSVLISPPTDADAVKV